MKLTMYISLIFTGFIKKLLGYYDFTNILAKPF